MSIKNAFKLLFNRFEIVGEILLYLFIMLVVFCGLGAIFVQPIIQATIDSDINADIVQFYSTIINNTAGGTESILSRLKEILRTVKGIFIGEEGIIFKTFYVPILCFVVFNLLFHMYELPLCKVLEARMSSNAKISLMGNVISQSGKSAIFVLVKLLFIILTDSIILFTMWGAYKILRMYSLPLLIPFVWLLLILLLLSFRKCFTITWVQRMVIGEKQIFKAFGASIRDGFGHFRTTFAGHFVCYLLAFVVNGLMALITFGVGLIISVPVTIMYFKLLEMTSYYSWNGKRYYLDGQRIVGKEPELTERLD